MSKVRNKSGGPREVPFLDMRIVEADEVVEVPDFQAAHNPDSAPGDADHLPIVWPDAVWEPVAEPKVEPELPRRKAAKAAAPGTEGS